MELADQKFPFEPVGISHIFWACSNLQAAKRFKARLSAHEGMHSGSWTHAALPCGGASHHTPLMLAAASRLLGQP